MHEWPEKTDAPPPMSNPKNSRKEPPPVDFRILEELTSTGEATGLEAVSLEYEEGSADLPYDPASLKAETRTMRVFEIAGLMEQKRLTLVPDYQRRQGLWDNQRQSRLIESLLLRLPIPSLYLSEDDEGRYSVVDGVQRLSAIMRFVAPDVLAGQSQNHKLKPLQLQGLEYMTALQGHTYDELPLAMQRRIAETELVMHLIRRGTPELVKFNIFERINTGGLPLSGQELRSALIGGPARDFLRHLAKDPLFIDATDNSVSPERLADQELILRYFAFDEAWPWETFDRNAGDAFLNNAMHRINAWSHRERHERADGFRRAMGFARELFGQDAFRKVSTASQRLSPINRALFEAEAVLCGRINHSKAGNLMRFRSQILEALAFELENNVDFWRSVSLSTVGARAVNIRFSTIKQIFSRFSLA